MLFRWMPCVRELTGLNYEDWLIH